MSRGPSKRRVSGNCSCRKSPNSCRESLRLGNVDKGLSERCVLDCTIAPVRANHILNFEIGDFGDAQAASVTPDLVVNTNVLRSQHLAYERSEARRSAFISRDVRVRSLGHRAAGQKEHVFDELLRFRYHRPVS